MLHYWDGYLIKWLMVDWFRDRALWSNYFLFESFSNSISYLIWKLYLNWRLPHFYSKLTFNLYLKFYFQSKPSSHFHILSEPEGCACALQRSVSGQWYPWLSRRLCNTPLFAYPLPSFKLCFFDISWWGSMLLTRHDTLYAAPIEHRLCMTSCYYFIYPVIALLLCMISLTVH